jgi:hypothetical protein
MERRSPDEIVHVDGNPVRLGDVPWPLSAAFGIGHLPGHADGGRKVQPGNWPCTPRTCTAAGDPLATTWNDDGTILACNGCGLDCT